MHTSKKVVGNSLEEAVAGASLSDTAKGTLIIGSWWSSQSDIKGVLTILSDS
jgi:hypothetical protein